MSCYFYNPILQIFTENTTDGHVLISYKSRTVAGGKEVHNTVARWWAELQSIRPIHYLAALNHRILHPISFQGDNFISMLLARNILRKQMYISFPEMVIL